MRSALIWPLLTTLSATSPVTANQGEVVGKAWSGDPVKFAMAVANGRLYIGYYDANRRLILTSRAVAGGPWSRKALETVVGWDSHNAIVIAFDAKGRLHVAANMHVSPLNYYISDKSGSVLSLKRVPSLQSGSSEQRVTYPTFIKDGQGKLYFRYRDGMSGNGNDIYLAFDAEAARWRALTARPVLDGEGERNAYSAGPTLGPDGWFHMAWVWRDSPAAETTHDLCYAKSRNLINWQRSDGSPIALPITLARSEIIDPVPVHGGMINNQTIGFDAGKRVMVVYHKFDANGNTQIYLARHEVAGWHIVQVSQWRDFRWDFKGGGTLNGVVDIGAPSQAGSEILIPVAREGRSFLIRLSARSLMASRDTQSAKMAAARPWPTVQPPPGMKSNKLTATGGGKTFLLQWSTLPNNRDQPRAIIPSPSDLLLFERTE